MVSDTPRGQATIELLSLNRDALVAARREAASGVKATCELAAELANRGESEGLQEAQETIAGFTHSESVYAALKPQLIGTFAASPGSPLQRTADGILVTTRRKRRAEAEQERFAADQEEFSLAEGEGDDVFRSLSRQVERVVIHNVKRRSARPTCVWTSRPPPARPGRCSSARTPAARARSFKRWRLADRRTRSGDCGCRPDRSSAAPERQARLDRHLPDRLAPIPARRLHPSGLRVHPLAAARHARSRLWRDTSAPDTRPHARHRLSGVPRRRALSSCPLADRRRALAARTSAGGLDGRRRRRSGSPEPPPPRWLERRGDAVVVRERGRAISLRELSTGYQAILATVIDILEVTSELWPTPDTAEGIVLLYELGAHLHPTWRMRVVSGLRRMLPGCSSWPRHTSRCACAASKSTRWS